MKKKLWLVLGLCISLAGFAQKFTDLSQPLPFDTAFRVGVLPNGMTYYIRHNEQPKDRASFYIIQNVGALLEHDNQDGLAHFLEHMAFNGTEHFPGKGILNTLENHGVKFGREINAYTNQNETVYNLSHVPVKNDGLLDTCLLILHDWSNYLLLTDEEIDAERGVIREEWRTRRNAQFRLRSQSSPFLFGNTLYAKRDVIGSLDVINTFDPQVIKDFYHDWYRTDLQAIAIVGDVDVDEVESKVKALFSGIPAVENPKPRPFVELEINDELVFGVATDKEATNSYVDYLMYYRDTLENSLAKERQKLVYGFFNAMINARLAERVQNGDAEFLNGVIQYGDFVRGYQVLNLYAVAREGQEAEAFKGVYTELKRVMDHGFTATELEREKENKRVAVEEGYKKRDQINNDMYCRAVKSAYLEKSSVTDALFDLEFVQEMLPGIAVDEVNALAGKWLQNREPIVIVNGPDKEGIHMTKPEFVAALNEVNALATEAYVDNASEQQLLDTAALKGGKIVGTKDLGNLQATEWTLSNGTRVVYRFTNLDKENIDLYAYSWGGSSVYDDHDIPTIESMTGFIGRFGIGAFDAVTFSKLLPGNTASVQLRMDEFAEMLQGGCSPKDFETMLQLLYMRFEQPRFDSAAFNTLLERNYEYLRNQKIDPDIIKRDTINYISTQGHPRTRKFDKHFLDDIHYNRLEEMYRDRYTDASDFVFFIVGDIPEEVVKPMVEKYIGSIRSINREESWVDRKVEFPTGKTIMTVPLNIQTNKSTVVLKFHKKDNYTRKDAVSLAIMAEVLQLRFTENIREKEGGTYGVRVRPSVEQLPEGAYNLTLQFDCDPDKADRLKQLVYAEIEAACKQVSQSDLNKVVLNMKKTTEQSRLHNEYYLGALTTYYKTGLNRLDPSYFDEIVDHVQTKDISKYAKQYFKKANVVDVVFYPEN